MHMVRRLRSGTERIPAKKFCGIPRESDFLWCEMPTVLSGLFFLIINCLFTCFDRIGALSVKVRMPHNVCKGHWEFRHTFSFIWQPAQIHIHVQLCLAGTSLYQRCLLPDEIPGAPNSPYQASVLWRTVSRFCSNMEKTVFIVKRKTNHLERWYFIIRKTVSWNTAKLLYRQLLSPFAIA